MNSPSPSSTPVSNQADQHKVSRLSAEPISLEHLISENLKLREELELLAYAVSHDLCTPIRHINQYVALASEEEDFEHGSRGRDYLDRAGKACGELNDHMKAVLQYSRLGRLELEWKTIQLQHFMGRIVELNQARLESLGGEICLEGLDGPWFTDMRLFQQLLEELVSNALKFAHPDRAFRLTISLRKEQETYLFSFADNGIGIPEEGRGYLFDLFRPLRSRIEAPAQGLGCGLAYARRIAERLGGTIFLRSGTPFGATFDVRLPFQIAPPGSFLPEKFLYRSTSSF